MKKKYNNKYYLFLAAITVILFSACEEGDKVFDDIVENETRGAILRTIDLISNEIPIGNEESNFSVTAEIQSAENGTLVQSVEVYVAFNDNTIEDGATDFSTEEVLAETLDVSSFSIGEFGLPRFTYTITLPQLLNTLPVSSSAVDGSDAFSVRFELVLNDGRRYSAGDNSGNITGSYFNSPFSYLASVVCPPKPPTPGTWTVEMQDSFGDGWQPTTANGGGPGITVTLSDGTVYEIGLCTPYETPGYDCTNDANSGTATFEVPDGLISEAEFMFNGDFFGEMSFQIITPNGNVVADIPTATAAGPIAIDFCKD